VNPQTVTHIHSLSGALRALAQAFDDLTISQVALEPAAGAKAEPGRGYYQPERFRPQGSPQGDPECPECAGRMRKRQSARGPFWGCQNYPLCRGTRPIKSKGFREQVREQAIERGSDD
jgi:hypothetical protein